MCRWVIKATKNHPGGLSSILLPMCCCLKPRFPSAFPEPFFFLTILAHCWNAEFQRWNFAKTWWSENPDLNTVLWASCKECVSHTFAVLPISCAPFWGISHCAAIALVIICMGSVNCYRKTRTSVTGPWSVDGKSKGIKPSAYVIYFLFFWHLCFHWKFSGACDLERSKTSARGPLGFLACKAVSVCNPSALRRALMGILISHLLDLLDIFWRYPEGFLALKVAILAAIIMTKSCFRG